jgi:hypothetical protein
MFLFTGCEPSTDASASATSSDCAEDATCNTTSRWVLRDKDGKAVEALVEPRCGHAGVPAAAERCLPLEFGSPNSFPCVRIIDFEGQYINLQYDLLSGTLEPCMYPGGGKDGELREYTSFIDSDCAGEPYGALSEIGYQAPEFTRARDLLYAADEVWYLSEVDCLEDVVRYRYSVQLDECYPLGEYFMCPFRPVPLGVRELLSNPPYTLHVEYE